MVSSSAAKSESAHESLSAAQIDRLLTAQLIIAWAGEQGDEDARRLGWWRTDLISEFGGQDLFERLLPQTWQWAVFQAAREAARRHDESLRSQDHNPDRLLTLFNLGFEIDERTEERLQQLKRSGNPPEVCLPELKAMLDGEWSLDTFTDWVTGHGKEDFTVVPAGRRLKGRVPDSFDEVVFRLIAAHAPIDEGYPLPHFRREP